MDLAITGLNKLMMIQQKVEFFASSVFRGAIFADAERQKLGASASNSLPFLTHPQKSLFPRNPQSCSKSTFCRIIRPLKE
jgi:hypothetical protein